MMKDLQVAIVGAWGVILVITQIRSLLRRPRRAPLWETTQAVIGTGLGLAFAAMAVAHFAGIHRQKDVHVFESSIVMLIVLSLVGLWQRLWQRWTGPKKRI
jgi:hypothetical protein